MALIQHLLQQRGSNVLVAVVPLVAPAAPLSHKALPAPSGKASDRALDRKQSRPQQQAVQPGVQSDDVDLARMHELGTAARVLQLIASAQVRRVVRPAGAYLGPPRRLAQHALLGDAIERHDIVGGAGEYGPPVQRPTNFRHSQLYAEWQLAAGVGRLLPRARERDERRSGLLHCQSDTAGIISGL